MLFQICPHKVTEKGINFYKFQSLNALKNEFVTLFFFLHGKQLPSQVFYITTFQISFYCSKYQRKNTNHFTVNDYSCSFIRSSTSRIYTWQHFENVNSY